ncbi:MAG: pyroglutamyl-peptidase I [Burkholderiales bacterium]|nr:pyroglutamyl-peptidase I [Burkholderiales bacterium]
MTQKPARCVLVTGFTPFGGERTNPSWEVARRLPDSVAGYRLEKLRVPTEFGKAIAITTRAIDELAPSIVICFGQAGGRTCMSVERIAINVNDARIADNAGRQVIDEAIRADGPDAYFCTVPIKAMVAAMTRADVPANVSNTAGTFVCNDLIYGVLHHIAMTKRSTRAGFIHVPYLESQVRHKPGDASMSLATMITGAKAAIMAAIKNKTDLKLSGGALH